jgi:hypothetical protein
MKGLGYREAQEFRGSAQAFAQGPLERRHIPHVLGGPTPVFRRRLVTMQA